MAETLVIILLIINNSRNKLDQTQTAAAALPTIKCSWLASYESITWANDLMKVPQNAACAFAFTLHTSRAGILLCLCVITHGEPALRCYFRSSSQNHQGACDNALGRVRVSKRLWRVTGDCWAWGVFLAVFNTGNSSKVGLLEWLTCGGVHETRHRNVAPLPEFPYTSEGGKLGEPFSVSVP